MAYKNIASFIFLLSIFIGLLSVSTSALTAQDTPCKDYQIIYARGSGQRLDVEPEIKAFRENLALYGIPQDHIHELNEEYKAVSVVNLTGVMAAVSRGTLGGYEQSVKSGKDQLIKQITNSNYLQCGTRLVLSGYSQGAQVVSEVLTDERLRNYLPQISFISTFGDPTLDLQTILGGNILAETPYYRGTAVKFISGGIVNVRSPYVPDELKNKSGAWCHADDMICTGSLLKFVNEQVNKPHGLYPKKAIPEAAKEIAWRLKEDLKQPFTGPECGALKQDIVLALNVSPSMMMDNAFWETEEKDQGLQKVVNKLVTAGCDTHVGLVTYGRRGHEPTQPVIDLTSDHASFARALGSLKDTYKNKSLAIEAADVQGGVSLAMDMNWREDAQKAVVVISDATGDEYPTDRWGEIDNGTLKSDPKFREIIQKSRENGGVEIFATQMVHNQGQNGNGWQYLPGSASFYRYVDSLVRNTSGRFSTVTNCDWCSWRDVGFLSSDQFKRRPTVSAQNIRVKVGQSVTLNAKDISAGLISSYPADKTYYSWFTDCKNLFDATSASHAPSATITPTIPGTCKGAVQVYLDSGLWCNRCWQSDPNGPTATIPFDIEVLPENYTPPPKPSVVENIKKERQWDKDAIKITWDPPANAETVGEIAYIIRDSDGSVLGATRSTSLYITDASDDDDPIVTVSAASAEANGETASTLGATDISSPKPASSQTQVQQAYGGITATQAQAAPANQTGQVNIYDAREVLGTASQNPMPALGIPGFAKTGVDKVSHVYTESKPWIKLSIIAIPLVIAIALGFTVKYGLQLRKR